jgi:hypothetical protein
LPLCDVRRLALGFRFYLSRRETNCAHDDAAAPTTLA